MGRRSIGAGIVFGLMAALLALVGRPLSAGRPGDEPAVRLDAEFHFIRLEYIDLAQARRFWGRGWWRQDWPAAEIHFSQGLRRLTALDVGEERHVPLTDDRIFDYPWAYATQVGTGSSTTTRSRG